MPPVQPQKKEKPQRPDRSGPGGQPSPALLTANIKKAWNMEELFHTTTKHESLMNHIHLSAAWNSVGRLSRNAERNWFTTHVDALEALVERSIDTVSDFQKSTQIRARELANIAHGVAKSGGGGKKSGDLMKALARSIVRKLFECNAQELANTAWAFAKADYLDDQLFAQLARAVQALLESQGDTAFNSQEITNTAWAFATASHRDDALFFRLARAAESRLDDFNSQGLSNTAWAFAKVGHLDAQLCREMANAVLTRGKLEEFNAQDLANIAWAYAKLGQHDAALFAALAKAVHGHFLDNFNAQGLANVAWAFAKAGHIDAKLFASLGRAIEGRLDDCNAQDLSNTAFAFAKACHLDESLFAALARRVAAAADEDRDDERNRLEDFNVQDLVNTTWAFAKLGQYDTSLFTAVGASIKARKLDDLDAPNIANLAWAFSKAGQFDEELFAGLARSAEGLAEDFNAQDMANVAWTFANAGHLDDALFSKLAKISLQRFDDFNDDELDNLEWSFATARQNKAAERLKQKRRKAAAGAAAALEGNAADVDVSSCGRIVVAGGGIGGAAVAVALQRKGFDVVVLEADESFNSRKQGYGLTVQGQDAIQTMGINLALDDAPSTSHYNFSAEGHVLGFYGEAFGVKSKERREHENSGRFIHIPRQMLRSRILDAIRPGTIRWSSKLKSFSCWAGAGEGTGNDGEEELGRSSKRSKKNGGSGGGGGDDNNGVTVTLTDGTTLDAALLIGSDGIFSTVRRQLDLPGDRLNYVGLVVVLGIVNDDVMEIPLAKRRIFETMDGTTRIYAMPFTTTSTMWQLSFPCSEETSLKYMKEGALLKEEIVRRCAAWHEPIPDMLRNTPLDCMSGYPVYDRDLLEPEVLRPTTTTPDPKGDQRQQRRPQRRVTLIGDAAHPMTPFKAQGANQAMSDAVLLADTLVDSIRQHGLSGGFDAALPVFERKMLSRSARIVVGSREKAKELHSALALQPARKAQREAVVDMPRLIRALRDEGIGARHATDPRGLDAVVEEVAYRVSRGGLFSSSSFGGGGGGGGGGHDAKKRKKGEDEEEEDETRGASLLDPSHREVDRESKKAKKKEKKKKDNDKVYTHKEGGSEEREKKSKAEKKEKKSKAEKKEKKKKEKKKEKK